MMKFKLLILSIFCSHLAFANTFVDSLFNQGNTQYKEEQYAESIESYHTILDSNFTSYELYFNLANSYYQYGKIPLSIYYYEKALQLHKGDDAINNLALAQKRITFIEPIPQLFYVRWWNTLSLLLSQIQWSVLLILFTWITSFLLILFLKNRKKWLFNGLIFCVILTILTATQMYNATTLKNKTYGIVLKEAKLFNDATNFQSSGSVDRGNKVLIMDKSSNMIQVKLLDGQKAWLENSLVKSLD